MKYYGMIYQGCAWNYDVEKMMPYSNPYEALQAANDDWNQNQDAHGTRLLLVIRAAEGSEPMIEKAYAFFAFNDSASCEDFIEKQTSIVWSTFDCPQRNGNFKHIW